MPSVPIKYQECVKCVMDTTDPEITFGRTGVCNHCQQFSKMDWERRHEMEFLVEKAQEIMKDGEGKQYDCLVGLSGGVDSSYALTKVIELGLRPLCFSIDNGWNTVQADENIMRLVEGLKVPFERHVLNLPVFKDLQEAFLKSGTANVEIPTDHVLMAKTYELAAKYNIKWIISGGNVATEGVMPTAWGYQARDLRFIKSIWRRFGKPNLAGLPLLSLPGYLWMRFERGIKVVNLLDYYEYVRNDAISELESKFGYKPYGDKHGESMFTWWFQNFYLIEKFGYDKRKPHFSSMINSKQMTRQEAQIFLTQPLVYPTIPEWDKYAKDFNKHSYREYPSGERAWEILSKIYGYIK